MHAYGTFIDTHRRSGVNRRHFLKIGVLATAAAAVGPLQLAEAVIQSLASNRRLSIFNTHTEENLDICYCRNGVYRPDALNQINHILRDHRTGESMTIKPRLLDMLNTLARRLDPAEPFHIVSGYRSPETNSMLHRQSRGVARRSFHTLGMAVDIRIPGLRTKGLRAEALKLQAGGVGYYPESDFIHLDCGPVRHW